MTKNEKEQVVASLHEQLTSATSVVLASTAGIPVNDVNQLRSELRAKGVQFNVVKNTLAKRALVGTPAEALSDQFVGPTAIETAVRVTATWADGFEYITLPGHPELGVARFSLVAGHFEIESWSRPGTWLTALGAPFSRWMQRRSTQDALQRVVGALETEAE